MCGIVLLYGNTAQQHLSSTLKKLVHRGPDDQHYWTEDKLAIGFVRLAINDESIAARQPYRYKHWIAGFNGEIYNSENLASTYNITLETTCDTHIIAPLFENLGSDILNKLDGFYTGLLYHTATRSLFLLRDYIGKKPLFWGEAEEGFFVVSELKVLSHIKWFKEVPLGISQLDLDTRQLTVIATHISLPVIAKPQNLRTSIEMAVKKRLPRQPFGIFLSGGLDSSIIAALAWRYRKDITFFTLGNSDSADVEKVKTLANNLQLENIEYVPLPSQTELESLIPQLVAVTESYNPSIISNGLSTYLLSQTARAKGIKVILAGEGADELFGGYHENISKADFNRVRKELINDMHSTELRRLDRCCMANSIEARCPFLDRDVKNISDGLKYEELYAQGQNKFILRDIFRTLLPQEILDRKKTSFDVGSGMRKLVVDYLTKNNRSESEVLKTIWKSIFTMESEHHYFFSYPTFDKAIAKRGEHHR